MAEEGEVVRLFGEDISESFDYEDFLNGLDATSLRDLVVLRNAEEDPIKQQLLDLVMETYRERQRILGEATVGAALEKEDEGLQAKVIELVDRLRPTEETAAKTPSRTPLSQEELRELFGLKKVTARRKAFENSIRPDNEQELRNADITDFDEWFEQEIGDGLVIVVPTSDPEESDEDMPIVDEVELEMPDKKPETITTRLSDPILEVAMDIDAWKSAAKCSDTDGKHSFPDKGGTTIAARRMCAACQVQEECLVYATEYPEVFGIWGGLSLRARRFVRRLLNDGVSWSDVLEAVDSTKPVNYETKHLYKALKKLR